MASTCKEGQLSKKSLKFLKVSKDLFGELVADYIRERLMGLSEEMQANLMWSVLKYLRRDEIVTTGSPDVDIMLTEIIGKLPHFIVEEIRFQRGYTIKKSNSDSDSSGYIN